MTQEIKTNLCKLCQLRNADKTGSHIIPFFLLRHMVNEAGQKERDKEISFTVSTREMVDYYFGKSLLPEKIEEVLGREITDDEIQKNSNQFTRDYIFCSECEKRFQTIETEFSRSVYNKIGKIIPDNSKSNFLRFTTNHGFDALTIRAFFLSIVWRCSISKIFDNAIEKNVEFKIRELLVDCLPTNQNDLLPYLSAKSKELKQYPMGMIFFNENSVDMCITHPVANAPYFFLFDEFLIFFYSKKKSTYQPLSKGFGIERLPLKSLINIQEDNFKIGFLNTEEVRTLKKNIVNWVVPKMALKINRDFQVNYFRCTRKIAPGWLISKVKQELSQMDSAYKYTKSNISALFKRYIDKCR